MSLLTDGVFWVGLVQSIDAARTTCHSLNNPVTCQLTYYSHPAPHKPQKVGHANSEAFAELSAGYG